MQPGTRFGRDVAIKVLLKPRLECSSGSGCLEMTGPGSAVRVYCVTCSG
jgi:hypothetical protein